MQKSQFSYTLVGGGGDGPIKDRNDTFLCMFGVNTRNKIFFLPFTPSVKF